MKKWENRTDSRETDSKSEDPVVSARCQLAILRGIDHPFVELRLNWKVGSGISRNSSLKPYFGKTKKKKITFNP